MPDLTGFLSALAEWAAAALGGSGWDELLFSARCFSRSLPISDFLALPLVDLVVVGTGGRRGNCALPPNLAAAAACSAFCSGVNFLILGKSRTFRPDLQDEPEGEVSTGVDSLILRSSSTYSSESYARPSPSNARRDRSMTDFLSSRV